MQPLEVRDGAKQNSEKDCAGDHWVPLSDLMTGLMMIFMLVAIVYMLQVSEMKQRL